MSLSHTYDVLIVGAGPVGLATAIALYSRGVDNILVIDQARHFRQVGQTVDILPNGLKALKCLDEQAYNHIKTIGLEYVLARRQRSAAGKEQTAKAKFWYHRNVSGKIVRSIPLDFDYWLERYGEGRISIPWYRLQTGLRSLLPSAVVKPNHRCVDLTCHQDSVNVSCIGDREIATNPFAHWSTAATQPETTIASSDRSTHDPAQQQFKAKIVVAADGINSTVRRLVYADTAFSPYAIPQYSGLAAIGCLHIENVPAKIVQQLEKQYFQGDMVVTLRNDSLPSESTQSESPRLILIRRGLNDLGYLLHAPIELNELQQRSPEAVINLAIDLLHQAEFPTICSQVVKLSNPESLIQRPYYIHPVAVAETRPKWSFGRLVLVGDAAHGMPPFAAQGANQGLEDAAVIGTAIAELIRHHDSSNLDLIEQQFCRYELLRRPLIEQVQVATMSNHNWSQAAWEEYGDTIYCRDPQTLCEEFIFN